MVAVAVAVARVVAVDYEEETATEEGEIDRMGNLALAEIAVDYFEGRMMMIASVLLPPVIVALAMIASRAVTFEDYSVAEAEEVDWENASWDYW